MVRKIIGRQRIRERPEHGSAVTDIENRTVKGSGRRSGPGPRYRSRSTSIYLQATAIIASLAALSLCADGAVFTGMHDVITLHRRLLSRAYFASSAGGKAIVSIPENFFA